MHVCDLKDAQIREQRSLIRELIHYDFELDHNATEVPGEYQASLASHNPVLLGILAKVSGAAEL